MFRLHHLTLLGVLFGCTVVATADIRDLATATVVEDFRFGDRSGTSYDSAENSANPGNLFSTDTEPSDLAGVVTDGFGHLNASLKQNDEFGTTLVDTTDRTSGRVFGVMELTWDFQSPLDPVENEDMRISLIDSGIAGVLAEFEIRREDDNTVTILGEAVGAGSTNIAPVVLNGGGLRQADKLIGVVEVDLDSDVYHVHYSTDAGANFTTIGPGLTAPTRNLDKLRLALNNDLVNDRVLIDRVYLATTPVPEPAGGTFVVLGLVGMLARLRRLSVTQRSSRPWFHTS